MNVNAIETTADSPAPGESQIVQPITKQDIVADLRALGVRSGSTLMVHTSLSALGWVVGGAQTVVEALQAVVGPEGTLVMPAQSWQLCDPAFLKQTPAEWWPVIRANQPFYDPAITPSQTMGAVAELFRTLPGALRSPHPHRSVAALGPNAEQIVASHPFDSPTGEQSPLGALVRLDADILLLGASSAKTTVLHLAEHRASYSGKHTVTNGAAVLVGGKREWVSWQEFAVRDDDFPQVVDAFGAQNGLVRTHQVGNATARLMPAHELVDFASDWFSKHR
ncbi:aminoglycoside N(3)-acetyltransferase [Bifidobacterium tibiigranuli]|jgi:aminoglycoside 3-N-acetyltransferase|uniref:aminoglycoside N(3)-acetyltransferase n=1 Tax=Bifidobacterium tibiigranuli TaxID=2172043 RepID=UPI0026EAE1AA|nr:AAC(3) family N-acetyltransferase [Bifidobacterium tibiigranuli]MCI1650177.1 AAC(3) family N-acetyltransferase [Bifidobacterium tibiigranuli]MCI2184748.1 AAC(3) family N-acetyltransferase [Bifidobacterium tibiigranuli]MCI2204565.1 AAC(3) family N-acetyltransferase [Bifidobacterium tibiigranuli]